MGQNEAIKSFRENLQQGVNPDKIDDKFDGVINKKDLSGRIINGNLKSLITKIKAKETNTGSRIKSHGNLHIRGSESYKGNGKEKTLDSLDTVKMNLPKINEGTIKYLSNIKTGILPIGSSEYNRTIRDVNKIVQNSTLGFNPLGLNPSINYSGISVLNSGNSVTIKLNKAGQVGGKGEVTITLYKNKNFFSIIKEGKNKGWGKY